ncbi:hypothetical protein FOE78_07450 [Microlunatus elymi]|uniref:Secreted protein n=1 Tax=Microlunatus elymi TaxID=2596828 RepID=A0A516PX48_9ACTN|nr:DUF5719 family protein [Microlunatus elymi]QDP95755.1 hypothetical protein FOE78_07450 [Microlunatus elymi]
MSAINAVRGWIAVGVAIVVATGIGLLGYLVPTAQPPAAGSSQPMLGRTSSVCTTGTLNAGKSSDSAESQVYAVAAKASANDTGTLTGRELGSADEGSAPLSVDTPGQGKILTGPQNSVQLTADGIMAGTSAGMVFGSTDSGEDRGLSLGACTSPVVDQWFTGLGAADRLRSQLVLSNPDDKQAEVDLTFFGPDGELSVPGGSGLLIPAGRSRTVSLQDLLGNLDGDVTVHVHASVGRVSAMARDLRSAADHTPTGADWHPASAAPANQQIIPAVPGGPGARKLIISNPGQRRANVKIEILGPDGPFTPADAGETSVEGQSVVEVEVSKGLAGQIGTVRVTSDQKVVSAVRSERIGKTKPNDIAINTAQPAITSLGLAPAAVVDGSETELAISNGGSAIATADVSLINLDGVSLYHERIPVAPGASIERRVTQAGPAYLQVKTPAGSQLYGGVTLRQLTGSVNGLAAAALITPSLAGSARGTQYDPHVAQ